MIKSTFRFISTLLFICIYLSACGGAATTAPAQPQTVEVPETAEQPVVEATEPVEEPQTAEEPAAEEPAAEEPVSTEPVYIGALLPLSEPGAPQAGQLILRGIELGAEYANTVMGGSVDGRPVEVLVEDDKGTPEVGASGYRRLVQEKGVIGVTGGYHSSCVLAEIEVAKELGAPIIATQASNAAITESGYPQVFRVHLIDPVRAIALVDFAKNNGFERVAYIADNTDFGVGLSAAVEAEAAKQGVEVKSIIYDKAAVDLTPELLQIQAWGPDLILNAGTGTPEHLIIDQAYEIGLYPETPMLATSDWPYRSDEYWELHPETGVGIYILTSYHKDMTLSERGKWFSDKYLEMYGEEPTYSSYNGFGDAVLLAEAAKRAGTTDYEAIIDELEKGEFEFWAGNVTFPAGEGAFWHQFTPPVLITQYTEANQTQMDAKLVYTYNFTPSAEEAVVQEAAGEPVYIGALLPLSEPGAPQAGQLILRGIELGAEYANTVMGGSVDGRPVEVLVEDDKGTPEVGASGYRRLVQEKGVIGVTGGYHSSCVLAEIEVAKELGAPIIATQASNAAITESGYPQVFRVHLIDPVRAIALVDFAKNNGFERVAYIADNTDFGVGLSEAVEAEAARQGVEVMSTIYDKSAVDLTPELLQIQAWGPDLILNAGTGTPEHLIIDQAYEIGLYPETPMLATSDWPYRSDEYWDLHPETGVGIYILTSYHKDMTLTDLGKWFYDLYMERYGEAPTYSSYNGFGDAVLLAEAAKRAGTTDYDAIIDELEKGEFEFWAGNVTFPAGEGAFWHQSTPPVLITQYTEANQTQMEAKLIYTYNFTP